MTEEEKINLARHFVNMLNDALSKDHFAISTMLEQRVKCNDALLNHPTIQCRTDNTVSVLGLLNGLIGVKPDGYGYLYAVYGVKCPLHGKKPSHTAKIGDKCNVNHCQLQLELGTLEGFKVK